MEVLFCKAEGKPYLSHDEEKNMAAVLDRMVEPETYTKTTVDNNELKGTAKPAEKFALPFGHTYTSLADSLIQILPEAAKPYVKYNFDQDMNLTLTCTNKALYEAVKLAFATNSQLSGKLNEADNQRLSLSAETLKLIVNDLKNANSFIKIIHQVFESRSRELSSSIPSTATATAKSVSAAIPAPITSG